MTFRYLDKDGALSFWTNIKNYITAHTPTKTSDLTNDSNFVDTSNPAVSSGITSAKVTSYDAHIADTDIHVTTADKNKWNNGVSQSYVFRYSSTALVASSTNSNTLLDNTDNLKVGDKVIDSSGVLFSITAIDTANSTFTIGTALVDLAQDSDVVHKSGNETVSGQKTFTNDIVVSKNASNMAIFLQNLSYDPKTNGQSGIEGKSCGINFLTSTGDPYININAYGLSDRTLLRLTNSYFTDSQNIDSDSVEFSIYGNGARSFRPKNTSNCDLGESNKQWKGVYATNYYYGANNVEFSTKFVTTDTNQTISGNKTFSSINGVEPSSLSLPSGTLADQIDISSYFTNTGSGDTNNYTASANGWIYLYVTACRTLTAYIQNGTDTIYSDYRERSSDGQIRIMLPIQKNNKFTAQWTTSTTVSITRAVFIPCQGNV